MNGPRCEVHDDIHAPVLCRSEHVWHHVVCQPKEKEKRSVVVGTHMGRLGTEARDRRRAKNARNRSRKNSGSDTRAPGSQRGGR